MSKINLFIIDKDRDYTDCLEDYLMGFYSQRFQVFSFNNAEGFQQYLAECGVIPDIILSEKEFFNDLGTERQGLTILFTDCITGQSPHYKSVNKYQYGEKIVSDILKIFSEEDALNLSSNHNITLGSSNLGLSSPLTSHTKVIGIYSPIGGIGKTTLAIGMSIQSVWEGKKVFYLNLENMASTPLYLTGEHEGNLSEILYFIKSKSKNLTLKIEGAKCIDPVYKIHYFKPPDSIFDFSEDISGELSTLLNELRGMGIYDGIFIDMSSEMNKNNFTVLSACDEIILLCQQDKKSKVKLECMLKQLQLMTTRCGFDITDKFSLVINKYAPNGNAEVEEISVCGKEVIIKIPVIAGLTNIQGEIYKLDMNSDFAKQIHQLLMKY